MRPLRAARADAAAARVELVARRRQHRRDRPRRVGGALRGGRPCLAVATHASNVTGVAAADRGDGRARGRAPACRWSSTPRRARATSRSTLPALGAAAVAMPGHKGLLGPSGTGLLYLAPGVERRAADPRRHRQPVGARGAARLRARPVRERHAERDRDRRPRRRRRVPAPSVGIERVHARARRARARASATALAGIDGIAFYGPADPADSVGIALAERRRHPVRDGRAAARRRMGRHDARRAPLLARRAPQSSAPRPRARSASPGASTRPTTTSTPPLEALRTIADRARSAEPARSRRVNWGGVVSFYASEHAMRAERVLERAGLPARLVPGPREVSPNCGVAVAFVWEDEPQVAAGARRTPEDPLRGDPPLRARRRGAAGRRRPRRRGQRVSRGSTRSRSIIAGVVVAFGLASSRLGARLASSTPTPRRRPPWSPRPRGSCRPRCGTGRWPSRRPTRTCSCSATSGGLYRSDRRRQVLAADRARRAFNATSVVQAGDTLLAAGVHTGAVASPIVSTGKGAHGRATARGSSRRAATAARPGRSCTRGAAERRGAGARDRPGTARRSTRCSPTASSTARPTAATSFKLAAREARHPAVGDRGHPGRPLRRRRHGHAAPTRAPTRTTWQRTPFKDSQRRQDGDGVRRPAGATRSDPPDRAPTASSCRPTAARPGTRR